MDNNYYIEGEPFIIECEFNNWTKETESMLMQILNKHMDLLPGLKINKLYKQTLNTDSVNYVEIQNDIKEIRDEFINKINKLYTKYSNKEVSNINKIQNIVEKQIKTDDSNGWNDYMDTSKFPHF